jgi:hypothetical protein
LKTSQEKSGTELFKIMPVQLLQQFKWEAASWKRQLDYIQAENAWIKNRIAEIATSSLPLELLPEIEKYQNNAVQDDYTINQYKRYLEVFINELNSSDYQNSDIANTLKKHGLIRDMIDMLEHSFNKSRKEFNLSMLNRL